MSSVLYGIINHRAETTYVGPEITAKNYQVWIDHWFASAYDIVDEFNKEGLTVTADAVRVIIRDNAKLVKALEKSDENSCSSSVSTAR